MHTRPPKYQVNFSAYTVILIFWYVIVVIFITAFVEINSVKLTKFPDVEINCLALCLSACRSVFLSVGRVSVCLSVCLSACWSVFLSVGMSVCWSVFLSVGLSVCWSVFLSVCLSVCWSVCLSVDLSVCLSVGLSFCLSVCRSVCLSVDLSVCRSVGLSVWLSFCLSVCLCVCLSVCQSVRRGKFSLVRLSWLYSLRPLYYRIRRNEYTSSHKQFPDNFRLHTYETFAQKQN